MKLVSDIFERLPQVWVLLGLLFIAAGLYLGFDYSLVWIYFGIGLVCLLYGALLFFFLQREGRPTSKGRTLSRDFISIGSAVPMSTQDKDAGDS